MNDVVAWDVYALESVCSARALRLLLACNVHGQQAQQQWAQQHWSQALIAVPAHCSMLSGTPWPISNAPIHTACCHPPLQIAAEKRRLVDSVPLLAVLAPVRWRVVTAWL